jgi:hypothetical protein
MEPTLLVRGRLRLGLSEEPSDDLPIGYITAWLRRRMPEFGGRIPSLRDRVLVVSAETGSGKSTVLPVAIFRILRSEKAPPGQRFRGAGVLCTQPRVLTAVALATDVSSRPWNPDMVLGSTVGFQTGPVSNRPASGLIYATAGVLAAQLRTMSDSEIMDRYRFIVVDEVHERSLDGDVMLMMLRNFFSRNVGNDRLPFVVLTSATFDTARYAEYFGVGGENVVKVVGRAFPIETRWPATGTNNYPAEAAATALRIHRENPDDPPAQADILIFVPGAAETLAVTSALAKGLRGEPAQCLVLVINREVVASQAGDFPLVFEKPADLPRVGGVAPTRRIIVSTTVAETGLTIDTLRYVVDCGWSRSSETYFPWAARGLVTRPAPRNRIHQRRGRVGRLFPGVFYPLYTAGVFEALDEQQLPEIVTRGCSELFLAIVGEQQRQKLRVGAVPEFRLEDLNLLDPPPPEAFLEANCLASSLGFLAADARLPARWPIELGGAADEPARNGFGLTPLGALGASFTRTPMEGVRVILAGYVWGAAASDLATAVAMFGFPLSSLLAFPPRAAPGANSLPAGARALEASLPTFITARHAGGAIGVLPPLESEEFYFRAKLIIADEFAEAVLLFDAFVRRLDASQGDIGAVAEWCSGVGVSFDALLELTRRRETVVEEMIVAGLNPFRAPARRLSALPADSFTDGIRGFKRCLYDGLRNRLLRYERKHPDGATYVTLQGMKVTTPGLFTDAAVSRLRAMRVAKETVEEIRPQWLLTDHVRMVPVQKKASESAAALLYSLEANLVSVLDGYVDPDLGFCGPRSFDAGV